MNLIFAIRVTPRQVGYSSKISRWKSGTVSRNRTFEPWLTDLTLVPTEPIAYPLNENFEENFLVYLKRNKKQYLSLRISLFIFISDLLKTQIRETWILSRIQAAGKKFVALFGTRQRDFIVDIS